VFVDRVVAGVRCDAVLVDNRKASREAVDLLLARDYRRIGFISGPDDRLTGIERLAGYRDAFEGRGLKHDPALVRFGDFSYESGTKCAAELMENERIDCLYAANIDMATGAFHVIKEKGIRVPGDIAFVMFDDADWATLVTPRVTAVRQPVYQLGSTAAELLFKRIQESGKHAGTQPMKVVLEAKLVVRESA
jgi:LacI family transcriptional regulator